MHDFKVIYKLQECRGDIKMIQNARKRQFETKAVISNWSAEHIHRSDSSLLSSISQKNPKHLYMLPGDILTSEVCSQCSQCSQFSCSCVETLVKFHVVSRLLGVLRIAILMLVCPKHSHWKWVWAENKNTVNLKSASFLITMLLHEGLIHSQ